MGLGKLLSCVICLILIAGGLGLIGAGAVSQYFFGDVCQGDLKLSIGYIAIIAGTKITLHTIILMAVASSRRPTSCGVFMVGLTFLVIITSGVFVGLGWKEKSKAVDKAKTCIDEYYDKYDETEGSKNIIDFIQERLECCGKTGPESFSVDKLPPSCCDEDTKECTKNTASQDLKGCTKKFVRLIRKYFPAIMGTLTGILGLMLLVGLYACFNVSRRNSEYIG